MISDLPRVLGPGIAVVEQPMPGLALPSSNCYLIATETGALVVDPGLVHDGSRARWEAGLRAVDRRISDVETIVLTHNHRDHGESAAALRELSGAAIALHPHDGGFAATRAVSPEQLEEWGVPQPRRRPLLERVLADGAEPDLPLAHGMTLATVRGPLRVMHTPGHTAGHVCLVLDDPAIVLTGDHVLPDVFPGAGVGGWFDGNPLRLFLRSLGDLEGFAGWVGHPGHGAPMPDLPSRARAIAGHHRARTAEVRAVVLDDPEATVWDTASRVRWRGGFESLEPGPLFSALSQTAWHRELAGE